MTAANHYRGVADGANVPTPPRLGTLIAQALDAVHDHPDRARAFAESSRAQQAVWQRLYDVAPEEYVASYVEGERA